MVPYSLQLAASSTERSSTLVEGEQRMTYATEVYRKAYSWPSTRTQSYRVSLLQVKVERYLLLLNGMSLNMSRHSSVMAIVSAFPASPLTATRSDSAWSMIS